MAHRVQGVRFAPGEKGGATIFAAGEICDRGCYSCLACKSFLELAIKRTPVVHLRVTMIRRAEPFPGTVAQGEDCSVAGSGHWRP
jgi:hypothetical protein